MKQCNAVPVINALVKCALPRPVPRPRGGAWETVWRFSPLGAGLTLGAGGVMLAGKKLVEEVAKGYATVARDILAHAFLFLPPVAAVGLAWALAAARGGRREIGEAVVAIEEERALHEGAQKARAYAAKMPRVEESARAAIRQIGTFAA